MIAKHAVTVAADWTVAAMVALYEGQVVLEIKGEIADWCK